jgi:hypothetical protein
MTILLVHLDLSNEKIAFDVRLSRRLAGDLSLWLKA